MRRRSVDIINTLLILSIASCRGLPTSRAVDDPKKEPTPKATSTNTPVTEMTANPTSTTDVEATPNTNLLTVTATKRTTDIISVTQTVSKEEDINWGFYAEGYKEAQDLIEKIGQSPDYLAVFVPLDGSGWFPDDMAELAKQHDARLLVFLETEESNREMMDDETRGWAVDLAKHIEELGIPVDLAPFAEPNLDEGLPWGVGYKDNTPKTFAESYKMLHEIFRDIPNISFTLVLNEVASQSEDISPYVLSNDLVDKYGIDGFNWPWEYRDPEVVFGETIEKLNEAGVTNNRISLTSVASHYSETDPELQARWMRDVFRFAKKQKLDSIVGFHTQKTETYESIEINWRLDNPNTLEAIIEEIPVE